MAIDKELLAKALDVCDDLEVSAGDVVEVYAAFEAVYATAFKDGFKAGSLDAGTRDAANTEKIGAAILAVHTSGPL